MSLSSLPPEILSHTLEFLPQENLASLITARQVCKRFQAAIDYILFHRASSAADSDDGIPVINPLFLRHFSNIFDRAGSVRVVEGSETRRAKDPGRPFRRLPWAAGPTVEARVSQSKMQRSPFLRPEASWRRLSVTYGAGPAIRRVDVVKLFTTYGGRNVTYSQLEIPPLSENEGSEGVLTMGLLYDLMVSRQGGMTASTTGWKLLPGRRFRSFDTWLRARSQSRYPSLQRITDLFVEDAESRDSAVLFITAQRGCRSAPRKPDIDEGLEIWKPEAIGGIPVVLHQWQGCTLPPLERHRPDVDDEALRTYLNGSYL
ncbi:hypothetical protein F5Y04DRAFT_159118 [Hypomontagnella monticulosa]|nr:hypothetical protein F5Y04DRAFT_159118 [Hypomontagnella monticulosa]